MVHRTWSFPWISLTLVWLYEVGVFISVLFLPVMEIWTDDPPTVVTTKWVILAASILHFLLWFIMAFLTGSPARRALTWHFGLGIWLWAWAAVAAFWWDQTFASPPTLNLADTDMTRGYILWKVVLIIGSVGALVSLTSGIVYMRRKFKL